MKVSDNGKVEKPQVPFGRRAFCTEIRKRGFRKKKREKENDTIIENILGNEDLTFVRFMKIIFFFFSYRHRSCTVEGNVNMTSKIST